MVIAAIDASAQKVANNYGLKQGQTIEVVTDLAITTEMPMAGESTNTSKTTELYMVKGVAGNNATIEKSIKSIKLNISMMGQSQVIDSDKPENMKGQSGEALKGILAAKEEFTIDANGVVTNIANTAKKKEGEGMVTMMLDQMNSGAALAVGSNSALKALPAYAVGVGDTWTDTTADAKGKAITTYTVKSITGSDVLLDYITNGTIDTKQEMMGMSAEMKGTIKGTGTVTVDSTTGLPKQKTVNATTDMAVSVAGQDMNIVSKTVGTNTYTVR